MLKELGVGCVLAQSFARLFYRNAFNIGLPAIVAEGAREALVDGERIEVDVKNGRVRAVERNVEIQVEPVPPLMMKLLTAGGAVELYRKRYLQRE